LLLLKCFRINASFSIKDKETERCAKDANGSAILQLHEDISHAHLGFCELRPTMALGVAEHQVKLGIRQAIQTVIVVEQEPSAREPCHMPFFPRSL
jgi:hypothetical protein